MFEKKNFRIGFIASLSLSFSLFVFTSSEKWLPDDIEVQLPPVPADNLPEALALEKRKGERTPERMKEIQAEQFNIIRPFIEASGVKFENCPTEAAFLTRIMVDADDLMFGLKAQYSRLRPHEVLPSVYPAIDVPWHAAYPSGHATQSALLAQVFSTWYPERQAAFKAVADRIADNREVAGVHYRSDSIAGQLFAQQLFKAYAAHPTVSQALAYPCDGKTDPGTWSRVAAGWSTGWTNARSSIKLQWYQWKGDRRP